MLYTRKGDSGSAGLFGTKERLPKDSPVYDALGTLDELNSLLGLSYAKTRQGGTVPYNILVLIRTVQQHLFIAQAELAGAGKCITQEQIDWMEEVIGGFEGQIENPHTFVIPGTTELSGLFDYARAVARRAERAVIHARSIREVSPTTQAYLNRLSSLLYVIARYMARAANEKESSPEYL